MKVFLSSTYKDLIEPPQSRAGKEYNRLAR